MSKYAELDVLNSDLPVFSDKGNYVLFGEVNNIAGYKQVAWLKISDDHYEALFGNNRDNNEPRLSDLIS